MTEHGPWSRLVDGQNQGWYLTAAEGGGDIYAADYGFRRGLDNLTFTQLEATRAPLRPVLPVTDSDEEQLVKAFDMAGRKAIGTLCSALEELYYQVREAAGGLNDINSYDYAMRTLMAGREGSWESEVLKETVLYGNGLNLDPKKKSQSTSLGQWRSLGPSTRRVDLSARAIMLEVVTRWVSDPERYTEVAATLAGVVSAYADERGGASGWKTVADQYLQSGTLSRQDFVSCYRLFYSVSEHFDPDLL